MTQKIENISLPNPPEGFATWLDYAVATADYHSAYLDTVWTPTERNPEAQPHLLRAAALAELDAVRAKAGMEDTFPKLNRRAIDEIW